MTHKQVFHTRRLSALRIPEAYLLTNNNHIPLHTHLYKGD